MQPLAPRRRGRKAENDNHTVPFQHLLFWIQTNEKTLGLRKSTDPRHHPLVQIVLRLYAQQKKTGAPSTSLVPPADFADGLLGLYRDAIARSRVFYATSLESRTRHVVDPCTVEGLDGIFPAAASPDVSKAGCRALRLSDDMVTAMDAVEKLAHAAAAGAAGDTNGNNDNDDNDDDDSVANPRAQQLDEYVAQIVARLAPMTSIPAARVAATIAGISQTDMQSPVADLMATHRAVATAMQEGEEKAEKDEKDEKDAASKKRPHPDADASLYGGGGGRSAAKEEAVPFLFSGVDTRRMPPEWEVHLTPRAQLPDYYLRVERLAYVTDANSAIAPELTAEIVSETVREMIAEMSQAFALGKDEMGEMYDIVQTVRGRRGRRDQHQKQHSLPSGAAATTATGAGAGADGATERTTDADIDQAAMTPRQFAAAAKAHDFFYRAAELATHLLLVAFPPMMVAEAVKETARAKRAAAANAPAPEVGPSCRHLRSLMSRTQYIQAHAFYYAALARHAQGKVHASKALFERALGPMQRQHMLDRNFVRFICDYLKVTVRDAVYWKQTLLLANALEQLAVREYGANTVFAAFARRCIQAAAQQQIEFAREIERAEGRWMAEIDAKRARAKIFLDDYDQDYDYAREGAGAV